MFSEDLKNLTVITGAGISAESGLSTFRDSGGLWEGHDVYEVASPEGWVSNPELVLDFYNQRRRDLVKAKPNQAHTLIAELEKYYNVTVITQNVDDLHERGGSTNVIHLHGQLSKCRSTVDSKLIYDIEGTELKLGDLCDKGSQLRPHIVWFGEMVPLFETAIEIVRKTDILTIIGTSLLVYPAASLIHYSTHGTPTYVIDPRMPVLPDQENLVKFEMKASEGTQELYNLLTKPDVQ